MYKSYSMELAGRTLTVDIGRVACSRKDPGRLQQERGQGKRACDPYIPCYRPSDASAVSKGLQK